ncbi:MAG: PEPxxWA-CTERM sorting domain-containing protein [Sphingomicrobium sp.]
MHIVPKSIGVALALALASPAAAQIAPAFDYTSSSTLSDSRAFTLGFAFSLSEATTINGLGYWTGGTLTSHQVGIWSTGGTLLASGTVSAADPLLGNYRYDSIAPLLLGAGNYVIGGEFFSGLFPSDLAGVTTASNFTWIGDRQVQGGFAFPTEAYLTYGNQGIALVNFSIAQTNAVPEPATWAMMLIGFGAIGVSMRRRKTALRAQAA